MRLPFDDSRSRFLLGLGLALIALVFVGAMIAVHTTTQALKLALSQRFLSMAALVVAEAPGAADEVAEMLRGNGSEEALSAGRAILDAYGYTAEVTARLEPALDVADVYSLVVAISTGVVGIGVIGLALIALARTFARIDRVAAAASRIADGEYQLQADEHSEGSLGRLDFQIRQTAHRLAEQVEIARERSERLRSFLSDISHQLKTPLASIRMYHELLLQMAESEGFDRGEALFDASDPVEPGAGAAPPAGETSAGARGRVGDEPASAAVRARDEGVPPAGSTPGAAAPDGSSSEPAPAAGPTPWAAAPQVDRRIRFLRRGLAQIDRMEWLVRNLLLEARMEAGALPLDVAPRLLGTTVTEAVRGFQSRALDLGVTLSLSVPENDVEVPHDRRWLTEAVSNLVKNALDNTPTGGSVAVTVRHTEVFSRIVVVDSGPGIRATDLPHIFDRFYRGRSTAESATSGTGLGLALAKAIVDRHGGVISATSAAAGPASAAPASAAPSPASRATSETAPPAASPGSDTRAPTPASKAAPADAGRAKDRGSGAEFTITLPHLTKL